MNLWSWEDPTMRLHETADLAGKSYHKAIVVALKATVLRSTRCHKGVRSAVPVYYIVLCTVC